MDIVQSFKKDRVALPFWKRPGIEFTRARHITEVLIRNGLGFLVERAGLRRFVPRWRKQRLEPDAYARGMSLPQRVRHTLEELGPTYIKLGQILSTRPDILPPEFIIELTKLLDSATPAPSVDIIHTIEQELNSPIDTLFATFDPIPIGTASIGQVHRATLLDGTRVVIKVQRPGVEAAIEADLSLLQTQARFLQAHSEWLGKYHIQDLAAEFSQALHDELDYTLEGRNADRLRSISNAENVVMPKVYWPLTTRRVITLSELQGIKLSDLEQIKALGYDLASIADLVAAIYLQQIFVHGVFHADPHPANILVHEDKIGLVDFGSVGYLTQHMREELSDMLFALARQDADAMVDVISRMGITDASTKRDQLQYDIQRLIPRYYGMSIEGLPMAQFLNDLMSVTFKNQVRLPSDLILLIRGLLVLEGVVLNMDPSFNLAKHIEPFAQRLIADRLSLTHGLNDTLKTLRELERLLHVLPRRADALSGQLERGDLTVGIDLRHLDLAMRKLDTIANRLSFSLVVAALIIGSALAIMGGGNNNLTFIVPFTRISVSIAQLGFLASIVSGALLLISILRSRGL
ncbi:MAG: ABC1 kinase family protein [Anaerolineae bacterium]